MYSNKIIELCVKCDKRCLRCFFVCFFGTKEGKTLLSAFLYKGFEGNINIVYCVFFILDVKDILVLKNQRSRSEKRYRGH